MTTDSAHEGDLLAVVSQGGSTVTFFDAATHERVDSVGVPAQPHELCYDAANGVLYCTSAYRSGYYHAHSGHAHEVSVIDVTTRRVVDVLDLSPEHGPHGLALDPERGLLYVSVEAREDEPGGVVVIDTKDRSVLGRVPTMAPGPHWFAITPDGRRGYATNKEAPFVSVVDLETRTFTGRIEVPGSEGLDVSPDGRYVYAAAPKADFQSAPSKARPGVRVIDVASGAVERVLTTHGPVMPVHTTREGLILAGELRLTADADRPLGAQENGSLDVWSPDTFELLAQVEVGRFPLTIHSSPDGGTAYVSNVDSSTVSVVDLRRFEKVADLAVDRPEGAAGAHGLAYVPYAG
ncbi:YncE family protein [Streptomyces sp. UNOC14_S4]|uniref:YncE family protein n=1 Tax=Streptomyces sp. UNOC14_S4 TaxID=2872340 RepID=UPI001E504DBD|nr:YncE family protein [Streptomyces sp. UNOC14_S4]MCC3769823.1 YncE family protein [Streptomyces sp. UNOC14_S4]